jgi:hypothetical protein
MMMNYLYIKDKLKKQGIENYAFEDCKKLAHIRFPESILFIEYNAFKGCENLTSVYIPKNVYSLSDSSGCSKLKEIIVDGQNLEYSSIDGVLFDKTKTTLFRYPEGKEGSNYTVPDTVNNIEAYAFKNCNKLVTVTIPNRNCSLSANTFYDCDKLEQVILPDDCPDVISINGIIFSKNEKWLLFYPCGRKEAEYTVPDGIKRINFRAFVNCKNLKNVVFPGTLEMIEQFAFAGCENLTSITLPANLKGISHQAFSGCKQLKTVTLSRKTRIGHEAFKDSPAEFVYLD